MHHPTDRITHTTAFVTPVVERWLEREIAQWVHPMKDRSDDPSHHERLTIQSHLNSGKQQSLLNNYEYQKCRWEAENGGITPQNLNIYIGPHVGM